jgi:hypothetical protein
MKRIRHGLFAGVLIACLATLWSASPVRAVPPDPDNAALLYYQAFLTVADLDKEARSHIADVARGKVAPNETTREYIGKCRGAIDFAEAARNLQVAHWGFRYSQGFDALMPHLSHMRFLTFVMLADARLFAHDGNYEAALDRCLIAYRMARHVGDETAISFLVGISINTLADSCLQDVLGLIPQDVDTLKWLRQELIALSGRPISVVPTLRTEQEVGVASMTPEGVDVLLRQFGSELDKTILERLRRVDERMLARSREYWANHLAAVQTLLLSPMPYDRKFTQLRQLDEKPAAAAKIESDLALVGLAAPAVARLYSHEVSGATRANAMRVAVELYLIRAEKGNLPAVLPADLPKDLFSGMDFGYEKTGTGFVLRCQGRDLDKDIVHEFTFHVR